jgi:large subunit ribosomal protein L20
MADLAIHDPKAFASLVASAKAALPKDVNAAKAS